MPYKLKAVRVSYEIFLVSFVLLLVLPLLIYLTPVQEVTDLLFTMWLIDCLLCFISASIWFISLKYEPIYYIY